MDIEEINAAVDTIREHVAQSSGFTEAERKFTEAAITFGTAFLQAQIAQAHQMERLACAMVAQTKILCGVYNTEADGSQKAEQPDEVDPNQSNLFDEQEA